MQWESIRCLQPNLINKANVVYLPCRRTAYIHMLCCTCCLPVHMASAGAKTDSFIHCNTWNSARIHITNQTKHESKAVDMQMRSYVQHTSEQPDRKGRRGFTDACKTVCCPCNKISYLRTRVKTHCWAWLGHSRDTGFIHVQRSRVLEQISFSSLDTSIIVHRQLSATDYTLFSFAGTTKGLFFDNCSLPAVL